VSETLKIVCLGDSITWGFPFGPTVSWVSRLQESLGAEVINKGINGNTTSDMLRRFDRAVLSYKPTHVVIMGGANDILMAESYDRIITNIRLMAEKAQENGIKVIFGLPTAIDDRYLEELLARIRDWMRSYAEMNDIPVIPFNRAFYDENGRLRTELLLLDGAHPAAEGYQEMFRQIDPSIFK
jgi:lysophospholipase L1-like esterase